MNHLKRAKDLLTNIIYAYSSRCQKILDTSLFDASYYQRQVPDPGETEIKLLRHYLLKGFLLGYSPHPLFNTSYYQNSDPGPEKSSINPLIHFIKYDFNQKRDPISLFSTSYYLEQNPDVTASGLNPLVHFLKFGCKEKRNPHPLFDTSYYLEQNPDVDKAGMNPLIHYLEFGYKEKRDPHPLFNTSYYLAKNPAVKKAKANPLIHYIEKGHKQQRDPHPLFDSSYYLNGCPSIKTNPLIHYLKFGLKEKNNPHPLFNTSYYLSRNPDVAESGLDPLTHYVLYGFKEDRDPHILFDSSYYYKKKVNSASTEKEHNPLTHYLFFGYKEGLSPHPLFNISYYSENNTDLATSGLNPLIHYVLYGHTEKHNPHLLFDTQFYQKTMGSGEKERNPLIHYLVFGFKDKSPHPLFDTTYYLANNHDVAVSEDNPLIHFIIHGYKEKRPPHRLFNTLYYCQKYLAKADNQSNPLVHFLLFGLTEQTTPHPLFNTAHYLQKHPEVIETGLNPLIHFIDNEYTKESDIFLYRNMYLNRKIRTKKVANILIIEHNLPKFDYDSGSQRLYQLLLMLLKSNYNVSLWAPPEANCEQYEKKYRELNITLPYHHNGLRSYLQEMASFFDVIMLCRKDVADHHFDTVMEMTDAKVVFDTVDLHYLRESREATIKGTLFDNISKIQELYYAQCADKVLVVSAIEKKHLESEGITRNISIVSNVHHLQQPGNSFKNRTGLMFIGGFTHPPNVDGIIWFVTKILPLIKKKLPEIKLDIVGSNPPSSVSLLASEDINVTGYVPDVTPYFDNARVFVSPLRYGAGVKGKIGQSMAHWLPVVTTSIGAEGMYLENGISALITDTEDNFADKVIQLYHDQQLWEKLSHNAGEIIRQHFSPSVIKKSLLKAIENKSENCENN